jgi:hypothetical protein
MSFQQCVCALDTLADYPALIDYVKTYERPFVYTVETDPRRQALAKQFDDVLNPDGRHSGGSWMYLIYILREVYKGNITYEEVVDEMNNAEERCRLTQEEKNQEQQEQPPT